VTTADHYFTIGSPHLSQGRPCEDYARSGVLSPGLCFGVVADGCSGAAASTEVGAQAMAFSFERILRQRRSAVAQFDEKFADDLMEDLIARRISEINDDYLATVVGFVASRRQAAAYVFGDGALALRYADGCYKLMEFEWANNTPYYLAYRLYPQASEQFLDQLGGASVAAFTLRTSTFRSSENGIDILACNTEAIAFEALERGYAMRFSPEAEGIEALAVLSDGIARIGRLSAVEAAAELLAFKNSRGEFVKRRCLRALEKFRRAGHLPSDDLAMAGVYFGSA
jgi:hypothetical protein